MHFAIAIRPRSCCGGRRLFGTRLATAAAKESAMECQGLYATQLLRQEHRRMRELFARYESPATDAAERQRILGEIAMALSVHLRVEEEVLHPASRAVLAAGGRELLAEAAAETVPQKY